MDVFQELLKGDTESHNKLLSKSSSWLKLHWVANFVAVFHQMPSKVTICSEKKLTQL